MSHFHIHKHCVGNEDLPFQLTGKHTVWAMKRLTFSVPITVFIAFSFLSTLFICGRRRRLDALVRGYIMIFSQPHGAISGLLWSITACDNSQFWNYKCQCGYWSWHFLPFFPPWHSNHYIPQESCSNCLCINSSWGVPCMNPLFTSFNIVWYDGNSKKKSIALSPILS